MFAAIFGNDIVIIRIEFLSTGEIDRMVATIDIVGIRTQVGSIGADDKIVLET